MSVRGRKIAAPIKRDEYKSHGISSSTSSKPVVVKGVRQRDMKNISNQAPTGTPRGISLRCPANTVTLNLSLADLRAPLFNVNMFETSSTLRRVPSVHHAEHQLRRTRSSSRLSCERGPHKSTLCDIYSIARPQNKPCIPDIKTLTIPTTQLMGALSQAWMPLYFCSELYTFTWIDRRANFKRHAQCAPCLKMAYIHDGSSRLQTQSMTAGAACSASSA